MTKVQPPRRSSDRRRRRPRGWHRRRCAAPRPPARAGDGRQLQELDHRRPEGAGTRRARLADRRRATTSSEGSKPTRSSARAGGGLDRLDAERQRDAVDRHGHGIAGVERQPRRRHLDRPGVARRPGLLQHRGRDIGAWPIRRAPRRSKPAPRSGCCRSPCGPRHRPRHSRGRDPRS